MKFLTVLATVENDIAKANTRQSIDATLCHHIVGRRVGVGEHTVIIREPRVIAT